MAGKGGKGLLAAKTMAAGKDKDKKKPVSRSSRAGLQVLSFSFSFLSGSLDFCFLEFCFSVNLVIFSVNLVICVLVWAKERSSYHLLLLKRFTKIQTAIYSPNSIDWM